MAMRRLFQSFETWELRQQALGRWLKEASHSQTKIVALWLRRQDQLRQEVELSQHQPSHCPEGLQALPEYLHKPIEQGKTSSRKLCHYCSARPPSSPRCIDQECSEWSQLLPLKLLLMPVTCLAQRSTDSRIFAAVELPVIFFGWLLRKLSSIDQHFAIFARPGSIESLLFFNQFPNSLKIFVARFLTMIFGITLHQLFTKSFVPLFRHQTSL